MPIVCSLDRYCYSINTWCFAEFLLRDWNSCAAVAIFLDTREFVIFIQTRICFYADRTDLALTVTSIRLQYAGSSWSVPTPPLAVWPVATEVLAVHFQISDISSVNGSQSEADSGRSG